MAGMFLRAAYEILHLEGKPLTAEQIVQSARERGRIRSVGRTPSNTMRARLSDSIRSDGASSMFLRTGANKFGLREWNWCLEYHATPLQATIPDETTVCIDGSDSGSSPSLGLWYSSIDRAVVRYLSDPRHLHFVERQEAETRATVRQLIAYVWLDTLDGRVLAYTRGKYTTAHATLLRGRRSVGFGGHVLRSDAESLFGRADAGIEQAALREITEEVGHPPTNLRVLGTILDDSSYDGQRHLAVVLRGSIDATLVQKGAERSINQLHFLSKEELWDQLHAMEFWSQLLIRQFATEHRPTNVSRIVPPRRPSRLSHIVFVGEIANGKSFLAEAAAKALDYRVISASHVLRTILGVDMKHESERLEFQALALDFISQPQGPRELATGIARAINKLPVGTTAIVDGVRQRATLDALRALVPGLVVIYIDSPRDFAFAHYQARWRAATPKDFANVREHPVEAELPHFRFEADAILNNADAAEQTLDVLVRWLRGEK
jgi:predicted NUDIX family phosphoesterase